MSVPDALTEAEIQQCLAAEPWCARFPPVLTIDQAAELLQVPVPTIRKWHFCGMLKHCTSMRGKEIRLYRDRVIRWFFDSKGNVKTVASSCDGKPLHIARGVTIYRRNRIWHARIVAGKRGLRRTLKTASQQRAERRAILLRKSLIAGTPPRKDRPPTIKQAIRAYMEHLKTERRAHRTMLKYRWAIKQFAEVAETHAVKLLNQVDIALLDAYRSKRSRDGIAMKTLFNETVTIKQLMNYAVSRGLLRDNPLRAYRLKKPKVKLQPFWTLDQVRQILKASRGSRYENVFFVLAETGMRIAEVKYLSWDDVDLEHRVLCVREKSIAGGRGKDWKPKTGDHRVVPLSPNLVTLLSGLRRRNSSWVFHRPSRDPKRPGFLPINDRNVLSHLKSLLRKLGLKGHVHTFRHSFISHALIRGVPEALVRQWVGHVDSTTIRNYTHIADKESHSQMDQLFPDLKSSDDSQALNDYSI